MRRGRADAADGVRIGLPTMSAARRTLNTEPLPISLVTVTSPPIMRASLRERARPSPVSPAVRRSGRCLSLAVKRTCAHLASQRIAVGATVEPVAPCNFSGCITKANS